MFNRKTVCFVTGASRGLGESIAMNLAHRLTAGSAIVLLARSESDLGKVKNRLLQKSPHITAVTHRFDQSSQNQEQFSAVFSQTLDSVGAKATDFQQAIFVHNAGTVQPVKFIRNLPQVQEVTDYLNANFSGVITLTTEFLKFCPAASDFNGVVINISSLAAIQPFKSWGMYTSAKAARDMFFKVLAAEEERIRVLNYAPGPLKTDMTDAIANNSEDKDVRSWAAGLVVGNQLLTCDASVTKLIQILEKNTFESGAHVDYYDDI